MDKIEPNMQTHTVFEYETYPLPSGVVRDLQARIRLRDGVDLAASVYRPANGGPFPVIIAISAYGKDDSDGARIFEHIPSSSFGKVRVCEGTSFEAPDPGFWVPHGYAVVQVDTRGQGQSGGDTNPLSKEEQLDYLDIISWAARQTWSTGSIGLCGVSYLAITQWGVAQHCPPALKAIIPWEGFSDFYLFNYKGGIPEVGMWEFVMTGQVLPHHNPNSGFAMPPPGGTPADHPLRDEFWDAQSLAIEKVDVPVLICASFSDQGLHTRDSFEHFQRVRSPHKWLYNHRLPKWQAFYGAEETDVQRRFFDRFLKCAPNGFERTPAVRLQINEDRDHFKVISAPAWPVPGREPHTFYLTGSGALCKTPSAAAATPLSYDPNSEGGLVFLHQFTEPTDVVGNAKLKLWVEAQEANDMDLFVGLSKLNIHGDTVYFYGFSGQNMNDIMSRGWLRVSHRELDTAASTDERPVHSHRRAQKLSPGEIVPVEIEILPSATSFRPGESLQLIVQGRAIQPDSPFLKFLPENRGKHVVWAGGRFPSHLLIFTLAQD